MAMPTCTGREGAVGAVRALRETNSAWLARPTIPDDATAQTHILRDGGLSIATGVGLEQAAPDKLRG